MQTLEDAAEIETGLERIIDAFLDGREQRLRRVVEAEQMAVLREELADGYVPLLGGHRLGRRAAASGLPRLAVAALGGRAADAAPLLADLPFGFLAGGPHIGRADLGGEPFLLCFAYTGCLLTVSKTVANSWRLVV